MSNINIIYIDKVCYAWNGKAFMRSDHCGNDKLWVKYYYDETGKRSNGNIVVAPYFPLDEIPESGSCRLLTPDDLKR